MTAVYPNQCAFLIDEQFSETYQAALQDCVRQKYDSCKDLKQILDDVSSVFPEIETMDAYVCKTDHLCFAFDAAKPLFLLNDSVVCHNARMVDQKHYRTDLVHGLFKIESGSPPEVERLLTFVAAVPESIFQEFDVHWNNDDEIALYPKGKKSDTLLFSSQTAPTLDAIALFKDIAQRQKKSNKKQVYDFRFNNQVIVK